MNRNLRLLCTVAGGAGRKASVLDYTTKRDVCLKVLANDGLVRCSLLQMPNTVRNALERHKVMDTSEEGVQLAKVMMMCVAYSVFQGGEERVKLDVDGTRHAFSSEGIANGEIRGHIRDGTVETGGPNYIKISKTLYNTARPVESVTPVSDPSLANLEQEMRDHFLQSGGMPVALWMKVDLLAGVCVAMFAERVPSKASSTSDDENAIEEAVYTDIHTNLNNADFCSTEATHAHLTTVLQAVFASDLSSTVSAMKLVPKSEIPCVTGHGPLRITESPTRIPIDFHCRCSLESFTNGLALLGPQQLTSLQFEQPNCPLQCQHCGTVHHMTPSAWVAAHKMAEAALQAGE